ncbi:hypothetical protein ACQR1W_09050 [Bradyrhizobium sp. HKCCYLS1011]|uniref:hypothetical protein n=1 Tax=Bradyrhizobium sp. HKCCYLS1011 TaxID=3420733 RepID=UPI003EC0795E
MASAFQTIVDFYVRNGNSKAIQDSLAHRRKLTSDLKSISNADRHLPLLEELTEEIGLLEGGLKRLQGLAEAVPAPNITQPPIQDSPPQNEVKLVGLEVSASTTSPHATKDQHEASPTRKPVEVLAVRVSGARPQQTIGTAALEGELQGRSTPIQIVGLTVGDASPGSDHQSDKQVGSNEKNDLPGDST